MFLGSSESPHTAVCLAGESCDKIMLNQVLCNHQKSQEDRKRAQPYIVQQKSVLKQDFTYAKGHMLHIKQVALTVVNTVSQYPGLQQEMALSQFGLTSAQ